MNLSVNYKSYTKLGAPKIVPVNDTVNYTELFQSMTGLYFYYKEDLRMTTASLMDDGTHISYITHYLFCFVLIVFT